MPKEKTIKAVAVINIETDTIEEGDYFAELECPASSGSGTLAIYENKQIAQRYVDYLDKRPAFKLVPCTIILNPRTKMEKGQNDNSQCNCECHFVIGKAVTCNCECRKDLGCCDKCHTVYTEHDYPAHTIFDACLNPGCDCHTTIKKGSPMPKITPEWNLTVRQIFSTWPIEVVDEMVEVYKNLLSQAQEEARKEGFQEGLVNAIMVKPSDKHWGNRTTFHETELENERFDQGYNRCREEWGKAIGRVSYNALSTSEEEKIE